MFAFGRCDTKRLDFAFRERAGITAQLAFFDPTMVARGLSHPNKRTPTVATREAEAVDVEHDSHTDDSGDEADALAHPAVRLFEDALDPVARALGYEVVLVEWVGRGRVVRIYLDHPNGVSLDDCSRMSRIFSNALDAAEADPASAAMAALLAQPYTLEVSSPGIDRPLVRLGHFARHVGARAVVRTRVTITSEDGTSLGTQRTFHGRIVATVVDPDHPGDDRRGLVHLRALDADMIYLIPLAGIRRANLVYEAGPSRAS